MHHSKEHKILDYLLCICTRLLPVERHGNTYDPVRIYACHCHTYKQNVTYLLFVQCFIFLCEYHIPSLPTPVIPVSLHITVGRFINITIVNDEMMIAQ